MNREEARRRAEVMLAFANGCDVQFYNGVTKQWEDIAAECVGFDSKTQYRVKPAPKYRPFRTQEECWQEMHKHPDFGWIRRNINGAYVAIQEVGNYIDSVSFEDIFNTYTFTDCEPFGIKEE